MVAKRIAPLCCGLIWNAVASVDGRPIVSVCAALVEPPLATVTAAVPTLAMSDALTCACNCVVETNVVARALPFHFTTDDELKPVPITVSKYAGPPAVTNAGASDVSPNGASATVTDIAFEEMLPPSTLWTATGNTPEAAMSGAVTSAVTLLGDT